jgi:hypothetical protein
MTGDFPENGNLAEGRFSQRIAIAGVLTGQVDDFGGEFLSGFLLYAPSYGGAHSSFSMRKQNPVRK